MTPEEESKKQDFESFLKEYNNGEQLEAPILFAYKKSATLQFCGWSISLFPDGTYFFNDTSGG